MDDEHNDQISNGLLTLLVGIVIGVLCTAFWISLFQAAQ